MSRKKLTLSVEKDLTKRAKAIAEERGTSVSRLVETFFSTLETREDVDDATALLSDVPDPANGDSPLDDYDPSSWAQRWRGAFAAEGESHPDAPDWEEAVLTEAIAEKHS